MQFRKPKAKRRWDKASFVEWWNEPPTKRDRFESSLIGAIGGFWLGFLGCAFLISTPVAAVILIYWGLGGSLTGLVLGALFPKVIGIMLFPFAMTSIGGS